MKSITELLVGQSPSSLRRYLQDADDGDLRLRRGIVAVSLVGVGAMALTTLLQSGLVRTLPDPPVGPFDTKKVNSSDAAYGYAGPDSPITIVAHGVNMVLATAGGPDRPERLPLLPLMATLVSAAQAAVAARYLFWQMPKVDRAYCPYCIIDALTHFATLALTLPESSRAVRRLLSR